MPVVFSKEKQSLPPPYWCLSVIFENSKFTHAYIGRALAHTALGNHGKAQEDEERAVQLGASREQLEVGLAGIKGQR